ncbi:hypothetical protein JCM10908_002391 [Rhodotorula pacifica]|uniref:uncharacterized protein n=1 Tax=Rhodotorula pacifica TaxID=1495444 RepID=UPI00316B26C7
MASSSDHFARLQQAVQTLTPLSLAESAWDNVGVMVEAPSLAEGEDKRRKVVCCIDLTTQVCDAALAQQSDIFAILTYHPPIFSGLKSLRLSNPLQRSLLRCISSGISVLTIHTAADNSVGGVNDYMASGLLQAAGVETDGEGMCWPGREGQGLEALSPAKNVPEGQEGAGGGRIVRLAEAKGGRALSRDQVVQAVKQRLNLKYLQAAWSPSGAQDIKTVAICAGSGSGVLKGVDADLYLTGEMGHHDILAANAAGIHVLCCNHSATERPWLSYFAPRLQRALNKLASEERREEQRGEYEVVVSEEDREPLEVV